MILYNRYHNILDEADFYEDELINDYSLKKKLEFICYTI